MVERTSILAPILVVAPTVLFWFSPWQYPLVVEKYCSKVNVFWNCWLMPCTIYVPVNIRTTDSFVATELELRKWVKKSSGMKPPDHWVPLGDDCSTGLMLHIDPKISKNKRKGDKKSLWFWDCLVHTKIIYKLIYGLLTWLISFFFNILELFGILAY